MEIKIGDLNRLFFYCSLSSSLLLARQAAAQDLGNQVSLYAANKEIKVSGNAFHTFLFKVVNHGQAHLIMNLKVDAPPPLQLISSGEAPMHLNPNDSSFVPVKVAVPGNVEQGSYPIKIYLKQDGKIIREDSCRIDIAAIKQVSLSAINPVVSVYGNEPSLNIPVRIINSGNTRQAISVIANYPAEMDALRFHRPLQVNLLPFSDTLVYLNKNLPGKLSGQDVFEVTVTGLYSNGDICGQTEVTVTIMRSVKYFEEKKSPDYLNTYADGLTLSMDNPLGKNAYYRLSGGGAVQLPYGKMGYNIDATLRFDGQQETYIRNTYLSYEMHNMSIRAGSINRNFDLNIYGSGIALSAIDTADKNYFEAGYLINGGEFLPSVNTRFSPGSTSWANFQHRGAGMQFESALVHQTDPLHQTNNNLLVNRLGWSFRKKLRFAVQMDGGSGTDTRNPWINKQGWSSTLGMSGSIGKFNMNSLNTYSSPYYPGLRRGARIFSERIFYPKGKINFWGGFNYYKYQPKYISSIFNFQPVYGSTKADVGVSANLKSFSLSFSPYYSSEYSSFNMLARQVNIRIDAWRVESRVSYNSPESQSFSLTTEAGIARDSIGQSQKFQVKISGNYNYRFFGFSTTYQLGSFYPGEALNSSQQHHGQYRSINVAPVVQKEFFQNKVNLRAGLSYFYNNNFGSNLSFTGQASVQISRKTLLDFSLISNKSQFAGTEFNDFQVSLTEKIPESRIGIKYSTLEVIFYKDLNNNSVFDDSDSVAVNQPVNFNNSTFITDNKGRVVFKNLPKGAYTISVPPANGWYAASRQIFLNKKRQVVTIPVRRTGVVSGGITYSFTQFSYASEKSGEGITIMAADESGRITTTVTGNKGNFLFYLPEGKYTLYIDPADIPPTMECLNNYQKITVRYGTYLEVHFLIRVKDRKVQIKKFTSLSMNK